MNADRGASTARRYLLGVADDEECSAIEREYFADEAAIDRIAAVEDDLVEDYLADRLPAEDRDRFEQHYLASPRHRARVEAIRQLSLMAGEDRRPPRAAALRYLAIAAVLLIAAGGVVWMVVARKPQSIGAPSGLPATARSIPAHPRIFAVSLSPIAVRSASEGQSFIIPAGTDVVALQLEGAVDSAQAANSRAVIQTVGGGEIWAGPVSSAATLPPGVIARFEVPAARLSIDDYIVVLFGTDAGGAERERNRYVLRLRSR
jgi:hypothetical protein